MAVKTEKLDQSILDKLTEFQTKAATLVSDLGQVHIRLRDVKIEEDRLNTVKGSIEATYDEVVKQLDETLKGLESQYPKGEIDMKSGNVTFEVAE